MDFASSAVRFTPAPGWCWELSLPRSSTPEGNEKEESEALAAGVRLATLAIETRKLYSDLLHRSEFDLLTDMYNRFSLDRHLEELIEKARETASIFRPDLRRSG